MNTARTMRARLAAIAAALLTALYAGVIAPAQPASAAAFAPITGSGSTWSYPAIHAWIDSLNTQGMTINYQPNGSAGGRTFFAGGQSDFAGSEIPYGVQDGINSDLPPARGFGYMPDTAGGLGFMYNLTIGGQRVTNLRLSGAVIAGIFTNKIAVWNDPLIAADNPGLALPALPIIPAVRSDGDGSTMEFTQWMLATDPAAWQAYCGVVGRSPCTPTSTFPVQGGTNMIGQAGDPGVATYVSQSSSNGAIGYVPYSWALQEGFPVAKVLNAAGYYTLPTPDNVGVSLFYAQLNPDGSADLSQVYTDVDPRAYELSYYSYLIVPTDLTNGMTTNKGFTLGAFGQYLLCQGQQTVNVLGYAALPLNLVEDGFTQLQKIPGASVPTTTAAALAGCNNPTFSPDGTNLLASTAPLPPACDQQGATQCGSPVGTTTTLTASPNPPTTIQPVTLTATVTPLTGTGPLTGTVQFEVGGTEIGPPVTIDASGVATTTTTFPVAGTQALTAVFTPAGQTGTANFTSSEGFLSLSVSQSLTVPGTVPLAVDVPLTGTFTLTVDTADTVTLAVSGSTATAVTPQIIVTDTRNNYPGWSVSCQAGDFASTSATAGVPISGNQLGWVPTGSSLVAGVTLGGTVAPAAPGLGTIAAVLASAPPGVGSGFGTSTLGANLTLAIPPAPGSTAGGYTGALNISAVESMP
jgi:ABC-type phosphate transport system substrate-binding protein